MFKWLTTSKKGFTLVELLIVIVLLGLGVFAMANIFIVAYRSYDKSEERYAKQETVKNMAEYFRKNAKIGAANNATIFDNLGVLPTGDNVDDGYSYIYAVPMFINDAATGEDDKYIEYTYGMDTTGLTCAGSRVYILQKKQKRANALCLNPSVPICLDFSVYKADSGDGAGFENKAGVLVNIAATERDAEFETNNTAGYFYPSSSDDIFYDVDVAYHFPNMVTAKNPIVVNASSGERDSEGKLIADDATVDGAQVSCADKGCVLRIVIDTLLSGDESEADASVSSFCFIATASYGVDSGEVGLLCDFRDKCLLTNPLGQAFVKAYYTISPPIADFIAENETLKAVVRGALKPLVVVAEYSLNPEMLAEVLPGFLIYALGGGAFVITYSVRRKKRLHAHSDDSVD